MSKVTKPGRLRLWFWEHGEPLGLVLAGLLALILIGALASLGLGLGPQAPAVGRIEHEGYTESEEGGEPVAVVRLPEGLVTVYLPRATTCRIGDRIELRRGRLPWGPYYSAADIPCRRTR